MTRWEEGTGREHLGSLFARTLGEGPPVVLLHGLVASSRSWGAAFDVLGNAHQLVVPDLLGFGRSPKPPSGYTPDDHVEALVALFDEVGAVGPAIIGAHSAGAVVALRLAATRPERVASVVAFGPPLYPDAATAREHVSKMGPMARLFALPGPVARLACSWVCAHRSLAARLAVITHPGLPAPVAADSVAHTWESYTGTLTDVVLAAGATSWLDRITAPIHLIAGADDHVVDHAHLEAIESSGGATYERWSGGHLLPVHAAERCSTRLAAELS